MSKSFQAWWRRFNKNQDNQEAVGEELAELAWRACRTEILKLLKQHHLGVGRYGDSDEISGTIHRLEVIDKIRKL